jgi:alcohol dehydrogenase class IV
MTFDFFNIPRIVFGRGVIARLGEFVPVSSRVMLVYNGREPEIPRVADVRQRGEPTVEDIDRALAVARDARCGFVIGLGGGSAIDAAKAVAGLLANGGVASDYMEVVGKGQKITKPAVPWIAIPTTAGTGAEVTRNAVLGWPEKKFKASLRSDMLMARVAMIDPLLQVDVPRDVTARSGMDALCQCIEAYVSNGANPMTDAIALKGAELASTHLRRAYDDGADIEAREGMALAALLSGIALTNAGLGAVHGFAAPLGGMFPVPHGVACASLLPAVVETNVRALRERAPDSPALTRYDEVARTLTGRPDARAEDGAAWLRKLLEELEIPRLATYGVHADQVGRIVEKARKASSMRGNPIELTDAELSEVLRSAI